jgi:8-oxo-dGTP pyrophosphatase MutT (NUDIX family)
VVTRKRSVNTVICNRAGSYLLQLRDNRPGICHPQQWNFFGGGLNMGENALAGGCRELQEETGIQALPESFVELGTITDAQQSVTVIMYLLPVESDQIQLHEGAGFAYFMITDLSAIDATPMTRIIAQKLGGAPSLAWTEART